MPYSVVDNPKKFFETKLYTGTGATQSITGLNFAPDWVWIKERSASASDHNLSDAVRGAGKALFSNTTGAEYDYGTGTGGNLRSFDSDGFSLGTASQTNANGTTFVSWCWDANGTGVTNTSGSRNSTVSANTTSGFSIVSYTGNSTVGTVGHGLGVAPSMMIIKDRTSGSYNWTVYHASIGNTRRIILNSTAGQDSANSVWWNNTSPTSTVFTVGTDNGANANGDSFIAYCFSDVKGFSKFGSYTGNGSTDGPFIYTGFKPAFILIKNSTSGSSQWLMSDNKRNTFNVVNKYLIPNLSDAEASLDYVDFLSNGFKLKFAGGLSINQSADTYIYMAFAENPFVSSKGIPTTAR